MSFLGLSTRGSFPFVKAAWELPAWGKKKAVPQMSASDLGARQVPSDPLGDWFLCLADLLDPKQVSMILRGALAGNLWQAAQLNAKMMDSWPTYRKCLTELRTSVKMVKFKVSPYTVDDGEEPSDSATEKAELVRRCFDSFEPDRFADEDAFKGMVFDLTDSIANGLSVVELLWDLKRKGPNGPEKTVRASAWVHPRHIGIDENGAVGVVDDGRGDPLMFRPTFSKLQLKNPSKFLVAKYKSKSGSPLGAGEMRCLAMCWVNIVYAMDWIRNAGQKYGQPFIAIPYAPGIAESEKEAFKRAAKQCGAQGYMAYPRISADMKPEIFPAQNMTGDNPVRVMVDIAEKWCVQLLLGQTLTSDTGDGGKGGSSYALGAVHAGVKQEKLESIADWIAEILQTQLATRLVAENWGEDAGEVPKIHADFTHVESPMEAAQRMGVVTSQCRLPVLAEEAYEALGLTQPQPGQEVVSNGKIGKQDEPMNDDDAWEKNMGRQVKQAEVQMALQAEAQGGGPGAGGPGAGGQDQGGGEEEPPEEEAIAAHHHRRMHSDALRDALRAATPDQLDELEPLLVRAQEAKSGGNGEWHDVEQAVGRIADNNRIKLYG